MCGDSNYFQHIATCLVSLIDHNPELNLSVVVLATKTTQAMNDKLKRSLARYPTLALRIEQFTAPGLESLPITNSYYPSEIYARFWASDYFPAEVDRVLYLDGDMVIIDSIQHLLDLDMSDKMLAAVQIPGSTSPLRLGYDPGFGYFNSGVMVLNLKKWREENARDLLIRTTYTLAEKLNDPDQDVLNYCYHDRYIVLDYTWNAISPFFKEVNTLVLPQEEIRRVAREAKIVHFNGEAKPWNYLSFHPHTEEYWRCLAKTEWHDFVPADRNLLNAIKKRVISLLGERRSGQLMATLRGR
jgi:lipopolysaccharide biosynthesis glycosyltransferase